MKTKKEMIEAVINESVYSSYVVDGEFDFCYYYKAILEKLEQLNKNYATESFISLETTLMDSDIGLVLKDYDSDHKKLDYFILSECGIYLTKFHRDYVRSEWDLDKYATKQQKVEYKAKLLEESFDGYKKILIRMVIEDYKYSDIEDQLYFLLLLEEYKIKPTEELYKMFCNSQEAFKRDIKISKLLAA